MERIFQPLLGSCNRFRDWTGALQLVHYNSCVISVVILIDEVVLMAIREMTMAKLSQLPDGLLGEVDDFIDFLAIKHSVKIVGVDAPVSIAERWKQWVEETDRLGMNSIEASLSYGELLQSKYRKQGLDL